MLTFFGIDDIIKKISVLGIRIGGFPRQTACLERKGITMFCKNYGNPLPEGAKFCGNCGTPVSIVPVEEKPAEAVEEKPVEAAEAPVAVEEKPAEAAETPVAVEEQPAEVAETPVAVEEKPAEAVETPAAVEEKPVETAETPAAVEEKPVEAAETTVAVEEKPVETAETPAAVEEKPVESVIPAMPAENIAVSEKSEVPAPKKKIKKAPIIAAAAAVVVAAGAAVGYFCFHDKITRLFMGNVGYAKMIEANSYADYMLPELGMDKDSADKTTVQYINNVLDVAQSSIQGYSDYSSAEDSENELSYRDRMIINMVDKFNSAIYKATGGNDGGFSAEYHIDISVGPQIKLLLGTYADKVLNAISELGLRYTVVAGDTSKFAMDLIDGQGDLGGIELYMNGSDLCIAAPEITESVIAFKIPETEIKESDTPTLGEEDIKRIASGIGKIYFSYFDKAEITYTDDMTTAAGKKGTMVSVKFTGPVLKEMAGELLEFIRSDSYVKAYFLSAGITEEKYAEAFDKAVSDLSAKEIEGYAEMINYVDVHNNVLGKTIVMYDDKTKSRAEMAVSSAENTTLIDFSEEKEGKSEGKFSIINEKSGEASGSLYFKMPIDDNNGGEKQLSIAVDYEKTGETTFLGNKVPLGKVTLRFADDDTLIDSIGSAQNSQTESQQGETSAKLMESIGTNGSSLVEMLISGQLKKSKLEISIENGENGPVGKVSVSLGNLASFGIEMFFSEVHEQAVMPSLENAIDVENGSKKDSTSLQIDVMKWVKKLSERNNFWREILQSADIDEGIEQAEKSLKFYDHYSEYSDYLTYSADKDAEKLDEAFNNGISDGTISFDDVPTDVELYFDSEGKVVVIESGSWYGDFPAVFSDCKLKSAYVRIGVTTLETHTIIVYTDKSTDLPAKLPDKFNFMDGVFEWDDDNVIGEFVVGTYPELQNGVSTAEDKFAAMDSAVSKQERYAEAIAKSAQNAERMSGPAIISTESNKDTEISLEIAVDGNGSWTVVRARENRWEEKPEDFFNQQFLDRLISLLGSSYTTKGIKNCHAEIIFVNGELVGVNAYSAEDELSFEDYGLPAGSDYITGYYFMWTGKNGIWEDVQHGYYLSGNGIPVALGTYCIETGKPLGTYDEYVAQGAGFDFGIVEGSWLITAVGNMDTQQITDIELDEGFNVTLSISGNSVVISNGYESYEAVPVPLYEGSVFTCEFTDEYGDTESLIFSYAADEDKIYCYSDLEGESEYLIFSRVQYSDSTGEQ